jgi:hypothetical protein
MTEKAQWSVNHQKLIAVVKEFRQGLRTTFPLDPSPSVEEWGNMGAHCDECEDIFNNVAGKNWNTADLTDWCSTWTFIPKPLKLYYLPGYLYRGLKWLLNPTIRADHTSKTFDLGDMQMDSIMNDLSRDGEFDFSTQFTDNQKALLGKILSVFAALAVEKYYQSYTDMDDYITVIKKCKKIM